MVKLIVHLGHQEHTALQQLAQRELRVPRAQAALILREELVRQGLLVKKDGEAKNVAGDEQGCGGQI